MQHRRLILKVQPLRPYHQLTLSQVTHPTLPRHRVLSPSRHPPPRWPLPTRSIVKELEKTLFPISKRPNTLPLWILEGSFQVTFSSSVDLHSSFLVLWTFEYQDYSLEKNNLVSKLPILSYPFFFLRSNYSNPVVYEYELYGHPIMWDQENLYVHFTGIWKALGKTKADIVKIIDANPILETIIRKVRGGFLKIQGTW